MVWLDHVMEMARLLGMVERVVMAIWVLGLIFAGRLTIRGLRDGRWG
jgi:hypothetical protein